MAASMMMAGTGGSTAVSGKRMAMAAVGPRPGSTPTSVPRSDPSNAMPRLSGDSAAANPPTRWLRTSTSDPDPAGRQGLEQPHSEHQVQRARGQAADEQGHGPTVAAHGGIESGRDHKRAERVAEIRRDHAVPGECCDAGEELAALE